MRHNLGFHAAAALRQATRAVGFCAMSGDCLAFTTAVLVPWGQSAGCAIRITCAVLSRAGRGYILARGHLNRIIALAENQFIPREI